ncbi:DUF4381 domain-containing protein [Marinimicrobium sp. ARAG 43.8]|uniref:DUF4381 domain-containing protein n=1 Tax=Marinimicrobium sp. ARAG 43.8 TaxID=3418719 RepID=UPI003CF681E3
MNPQDPLAQLKDIHLPDPVGWWPLAWGWWMLLAVLLLAAGLLVWRWRARRRRQQYRREALVVLRDAQRRYRAATPGPEASRRYLQDISELLRRTVLSGLPERLHPAVAALNGRQWLALLDTTAPTKSGFEEGPGQILAEGPYQPNPEFDDASLYALVSLWIKRHRLDPHHLPETVKPEIVKKGAAHA